MWFILPPTEGIRNSNGKEVQEEVISKGVGSDSQGLFSRDFETRIIVFIDDLILTVIAQNAFFTAYLYDIVYVYMNVISS